MSKESHVALYRKYRPAKFSDVVGQEQAVELLTKAITQKKISHAYLFCGSRGTGKTTVARIVARDIGCSGEDIIEIDAASNRGIDEIRALRDAVRTMPFSSPYKVYIIDEAHMLTKEAANALLKTLEEPPSHVVFILATTDPDKLPQTIVSRCQKIIFKQPNNETLQKQLLSIAEQEGKVLPGETALLLAQHGKGSYRDALGILEQVLMISQKSVKHEAVVEMLGVSDRETLHALLEVLCKKDTKGMVEIVENMQLENNALRVYDDFIDLIRLTLLIRVKSTEIKDEALLRLATEYPYMVSSKTLLTLLEKRHLLEVSDAHAWTAFTAILISLTEIS